MNYEKEYKEAFKRAERRFDPNPADGYAGYANGIIEDIFPQFIKREDERTRKEILDFIKSFWADHKESIPRISSWLAYLEKQKEPHFTKRNALFDKCVENCDPKTVEEVNKRVDDIMNMPELSAFEQALTNFICDWEDDEERWADNFVKKHGKHILDMAREELQKEQKPVEKEITLTSFEGTLNTFLFDFANSPIEDCEPKEYIKKHSAEILKAAYKELNAKLQQDIFEARQEGIRDGYEVAKAEQKPAEWSEEDRLHYTNVLGALEYVKGCKSDYDKIEAIKSDIAWLKSLRPSWKPSEDEERLINTSISFLKDFADKGYENAVECIDWLKSKLNNGKGIPHLLEGD